MRSWCVTLVKLVLRWWCEIEVVLSDTTLVVELLGCVGGLGVVYMTNSHD